MSYFRANKSFLAKTLVSGIFLLGFFHATVFAQSSGKNAEADGHLYIMTGIKALGVSASQIDFGYMDESPAPDSMFSSTMLNKRSSAYNIALGFDFNIKKHFYGKFNVDLYARQVYGMNADLGGGLRFNAGRLCIMPGADFSFGFSQIGLGKLPNSETYIQVDDTKFAGKDVKVSANEFFMGIKPQITLNYALTRDVSFRMNGGYHFNFFRDSYISFSGKGEDGMENVNAREDINDKNVFFNVNGASNSLLPYNYNGFFFNFGIAVNIREGSVSREERKSGRKDESGYEYNSGPGYKPKLEEKPRTPQQPSGPVRQ